MRRIYRILPAVCFIAAVVAMLALHGRWPGRLVAPRPWNLLGVLPMLGGLTLWTSCVRRFQDHHTSPAPGAQPGGLVTDGPYSLSRNPMYLALTLILIGIALYLGTLTPWAVPPLFLVAIDRLVVVHEERALAHSAGAAYLDYASRVRRWI